MLYLILLHYTAPLSRIDALLPAHREYLARHYASGHFQLSGRREPREGGVILLRADSPNEALAIAAADPFVTEGAAYNEVLAFDASQRSAHIGAALAPAAAVAGGES